MRIQIIKLMMIQLWIKWKQNKDLDDLIWDVYKQ